MNGMEKMTKKEMEMGTNLMNSGQKDKASRYIQFCYEVCGY